MGSPSSRLNVRESLRPWLESGLQFLFCPGGLAVDEHPSSGLVQAGQDQSNTYPVQPVVQPAGQRPLQIAQQSHTAAQAVSTTAVQEFPQPWSSFLKFAKPEPRVVWTYMELGLDLGGQSDKRRSSVLKNLQAHLKWPAGTINFWPVSALIGGTLQPDTQMFWRGWEMWRTPHIVCFGDEALKVVLPDADIGLGTHLLEHVIVHKLPPLTKLMTLLPHEQQMSVDSIANIRL